MPRQLKIYRVRSTDATLSGLDGRLLDLVFEGAEQHRRHRNVEIMAVGTTKTAVLNWFATIPNIPKRYRTADLVVDESTPTQKLVEAGLLDRDGDVVIFRHSAKDNPIVQVRDDQATKVATWRYESAYGGRGLYVEKEQI